MLNAKKKKKLNLAILGIVLVVGIFLLHSCLAKRLEVFPNSGIGFGLSCNFLVCLAFLTLVVIMILFWHKQDLGLMFIAVGGVVNFVDRLIFGYVRDYWHFVWFYNNLADWIIIFGVLYSVTILWKKK